MQIQAYLSFNGTCRQAFAFYAELLGGEVSSIQTYGEMPGGDDHGAEAADRILHAVLDVGGNQLLGADRPPGRDGTSTGTHISVTVDSAAEADRIYAALANGGEEEMPIAETFWATRFGMVVDRFGIPWMVNCNKAG